MIMFVFMLIELLFDVATITSWDGRLNPTSEFSAATSALAVSF